MDHQLGIGQNFSISTATWFPNPSPVLSGTINTTTGRLIIGTSTKFRSEVSPGDWILVPGSNEVQQVGDIDDDTTLHLFNPFIATVTTPATSTYQRIKHGGIKELKITFVTAAGTIRGASQLTTAAASWPAGILNDLKYDGRLDPQLIIPGGSGTASVQTVI